MRELDGVVGQLAISLDDAVVVGIGYDSGTVVHNLHPFCFGAQDNTGLFKEEGLFLHSATVGHDEFGVLLQHGDVEETGRGNDCYQGTTG